MHCTAPIVCTEKQVDVTLLRSGRTDVLLPQLQQLAIWRQASAKDVTITQCSDAFSNLVFRCQLHNHQDPDACVLLRVHAGQHELVNRDQDLFASAMVSSCGLGPRILALFGNGRIEEFLTQHRSFEAADMRDPALSAAVAEAMAAFHFSVTACVNNALARGTPCDLSPILFRRARHWLDLTRQAWGPTDSGLPLDDFATEIDLLEARLSALHPASWTAFCHNDLLCGNIMHRTDPLPSPLSSSPTAAPPNLSSISNHPNPLASPPTSDPSLTPTHPNPPISQPTSTAIPQPSPSSSRSNLACPQTTPPTTSLPSCRTNPIVLIDYEFAGFNPVAFDIANHWCEWAADYHTDQPHVLDYSKFPDAAAQLAFARRYLKQLVELLGEYRGAGGVGAGDGGRGRSGGGSGMNGAGCTGGVGWASGADEENRAGASRATGKGGANGVSATSGEGAGEAAGGAGAASSGVGRRFGTAGATGAQSSASCTASHADPDAWMQGVCQLLGVQRQEDAGSLGDAGLEEAARKLVDAVNDYRCMAHLLQVLASYIFVKKSTVEFDFIGFAQQHLEQYQRLKTGLLAA